MAVNRKVSLMEFKFSIELCNFVM